MQEQLNLFESTRTAGRLEDFLNEGQPQPVRLKLTRNQVSMVSIRFNNSHTVCRVHESFLEAPHSILNHLRCYLCTRRKRDWEPVADYAQNIRITGKRPPAVTMQGAHFDLAALLQEVNNTWFQGEISVAITWGRNPRRKKGRHYTSIHFGSYSSSSNLIRIHPRLDQTDIPESFVKYVIFHEMLHIVHPPFRRNGRWVFHPPAFKAAEKKFPEFQRMQEIASSIVNQLRDRSCA